MARVYAKLKTSIWGDDDYRALTTDGQWLYEYLFSSPKIDICGVTEWSLKRIAAKACDLTERRVARAGSVLARAGFIVVDLDTDEVLVRSYIRHDDSMKGSKTAKGVMNAWADATSDRIRTVIAAEVVRIRDEHPDWSGCSEIHQKLIEKAARYSADTLSDPYPEASDTLSDTPSPAGPPMVGGYPIRYPIDTLCEGVSDTPSGTEKNRSDIATLLDGYQPPTNTCANAGATGANELVLIDQPAQAPERDYDAPGFTEFWDAYPRKRDKKPAAEKYKAALKATSPDALIASAKAYAIETAGMDEKYIKLAKTWLSQESWTNKPAGPPMPAVQQMQLGRQTKAQANQQSLMRQLEIARQLDAQEGIA